MKQCKCEHWQECPVCQPRRFDSEGNRLPPEPTPLQAARARVAELERERERNLDSINVGNAIINKKNERIKELEAEITGWKADQKENLRNQVALHQRVMALEAALDGALKSMQRVNFANYSWACAESIAKLKEVRPTPQQAADQRAWEWQNQHHIRRQFEDDDFQPGAI